jgi:hypothetical protein
VWILDRTAPASPTPPPPDFGYHDVERSAFGFVLETKTWPVFLEWCRAQAVTPAARAWLEASPDLEAMRNEWLRHSPDPAWQAVADMGGADAWRRQ